MNRRSFLRSIAIACGAAVMCPGELLKGKTEHELKSGWYDVQVFSEADRIAYCKKIGIGERSKHIIYGIPYYFRGTPIFYRKNLPT